MLPQRHQRTCISQCTSFSNKITHQPDTYPSCSNITQPDMQNEFKIYKKYFKVLCLSTKAFPLQSVAYQILELFQETVENQPLYALQSNFATGDYIVDKNAEVIHIT